MKMLVKIIKGIGKAICEILTGNGSCGLNDKDGPSAR